MPPFDELERKWILRRLRSAAGWKSPAKNCSSEPVPWTRLEADEASFRIGFQDGSIIRSMNQLDVRGPGLKKVDFWLAADDNSQMPKDPQSYPANLVE